MPVLAVIGAIGVLLVGGVAYAIGASGAADKNDVVAESKTAYADSFSAAQRRAESESRIAAVDSAEADGSRRGRIRGAKDGKAKANEEIAAKNEAEQAASDQPPFIPHSPQPLPGLVTLPNGKKGWVFAPEDSTLGCVGIEQEPPHNCVGD